VRNAGADVCCGGKQVITACSADRDRSLVCRWTGTDPDPLRPAPVQNQYQDRCVLYNVDLSLLACVRDVGKSVIGN